MTTRAYPPISPGTSVRTTEPNMSMRREWTDEGWASKKWGVQGTVITHHDSHGLCYDVRHEDGTQGCYDPSELEVVVAKVERKVIVQKWEESERGWGTRPDGYSLHLTDESLKAFVQKYWDGMPDEIPDEYSRPDGTPYEWDVDEKIYLEIEASENGTRHHDTAPGSGGSDGWVPTGPGQHGRR